MTDIDARRTLEVWLAGKRETVGNIAEAAESVLAELARLARDRDAYLSRLVWSNGDGRWWSTAVNVENPGQHTKHGQSLDAFRTVHGIGYIFDPKGTSTA